MGLGEIQYAASAKASVPAGRYWDSSEPRAITQP